MDYRTAAYPEEYKDLDFHYYANTEEVYIYDNSRLATNETCWDLSGGEISFQSLELQPYKPVNFNVSGAGNYPFLTWSHSSKDDYLEVYEIYRKVGKFGFFSKIDEVSSATTSYTDYDYVPGSSVLLTYKIRAKNGSGPSAYSEFTNEKYIYGDLYKEGANEIYYEFNLAQNYPNPFNPTTTITYSIPEQEFINLKVYDALGKEIIDLVNEEKEAGQYSFDFNAENLPSGIYFYTISAGKNTYTKKLLLVK